MIYLYSCTLNCEEKVAVSSKLALIGLCENCPSTDEVQYNWYLWQDENKGGLFTQLTNFTQLNQLGLYFTH